MKRRKRLSSMLARQWTLFTLTLLIAFSAMAVLLLFLLEDQFIDARLREHASTPAHALPANITRYDFAHAPEEMQLRLRSASTRKIHEFRLHDGRYVHAVLQDGGTGRAILVYDASDQLYVNRAFVHALPWLLAIALLLALMSWWLARRFIAGVIRQLDGVFGNPAETDLHASLRHIQAHAEVEEFSQLAAIAADALQANRDALEREKQTLAFLAHEIRTPLQSAKNSLALLEPAHGNPAAWQRLRRSLARLGRASHAVLWMASARAGASGECCDGRVLIDGLADEFQPMLEARGMQLAIDAPSRLHWPLPAEVAEAVLANLLHNVVLHGAPGSVHLAANDEGFEINNPCDPRSTQAGFGLGLSIVNRLLEPFGMRAQAPLMRDAGIFQVKVGATQE